MDFQSEYEKEWMRRKKTAEPTPATLTKLWVCGVEMWPFPLKRWESVAVGVRAEKKQRGRRSWWCWCWCWAWSQSIAWICCWIGTFTNNYQELHISDLDLSSLFVKLGFLKNWCQAKLEIMLTLGTRERSRGPFTYQLDSYQQEFYIV